MDEKINKLENSFLYIWTHSLRNFHKTYFAVNNFVITIIQFQNKSSDYSCPYVTLATEMGLIGIGITFTAGRGNEIGTLTFNFVKLVSNLCFRIKTQITHARI